jgi:pyruvate/2-oxoglutarate dehydrogenase complex dihydrolipoamide acyltransferase (E2) component
MMEAKGSEGVCNIKMPSLAVGMEEGVIVEWLVGVGETVDRDERLCVVETEKVNMDVEAPVAGRVRAILVAEGMAVAVGDPIIILEVET